MVHNRKKKQKKRGNNSVKPRTISITLEMSGAPAINGVGIDKNGKVIAINGNKVIEPKVANIQASYERRKGAKILNRTNLQKEQLIANANEALLKYDMVYAIDTNTVTINGEYFSISCIVFCTLAKTQTDIQAQFATMQCLEFRGIAEKQENIAWVKAIQMITASSAPIYYPRKSIGLIVDSDLGNIPEYNSRTKPIYDDVFLPDNFELIYASADTGKIEYLANKLISVCDKEASSLIHYIQENPNNNENLKQEIDKPYTHFRAWNKEII